MKTTEINPIIDNARFTGFHGMVVLLCALLLIFDGYDRETVATFRHSINREDLPLVASTIGTTPDDREAEFQLGVKCLVQGISAELEHGQI